MSECHLPHRAFCQKQLDQGFILSINVQAFVKPEILHINCKRTSRFPPAQIIQIIRLTLEHKHTEWRKRKQNSRFSRSVELLVRKCMKKEAL